MRRLSPLVLLLACQPPQVADTDVDSDTNIGTETDTDPDTNTDSDPDTDLEDTDNPGHDVLRDGGSVTLDVAVGETASLWLPGVDGSGHLVSLVADTPANGDVSIAGLDGASFVSSGWCCVVPNRHTLFVPPDRARPGVVITVRHTGGEGPLHVTLTSAAAGAGSAASSAVAWTPNAAGWSVFADRTALNGKRYVKVRPTHTGPHRFTLNGPNDPMATAFTSVSDPSGSRVAFANAGGSCRPGNGGTCVVFLEKDRDAWLELADGAGDASSWWIVGFAPAEDYMTVTDGASGRLSLPAGTTHHGWLAIPGHQAAQLTLVSVSAAFGDGGFYDPDRAMWISNGFCCGVGNTQRYFVPGGRAWGAVETQVGSWADNTEDLVVDFAVAVVPDGASAADAVPYTSGTANHVLDKGEKRYLSYRAFASGEVSFQANGMSWASTKVGLDMAVYTNSSDPTGSRVTTCNPVYTASEQYETVCTFAATGGTTYGLEISQSGADDVMYAIWKR